MVIIYSNTGLQKRGHALAPLDQKLIARERDLQLRSGAYSLYF